MLTQKHFSETELRGARNILLECGYYKVAERTVIVFDALTRPVALCLQNVAQSFGGDVALVETSVAKMHGEEPDSTVGEALKNADLVLGLREKSMAHTIVRKRLTDRGGRYLSLPDYSLGLLSDPCIHVDYSAQYDNVQLIAQALSSASLLRATTDSGTDITMNVTGRTGNCCPGFVKNEGDLGSPPDIEANIAPIESDSNGIIVVDGSIAFPGFGLLNQPVSLEISNGRITKIDGPKKDVADLMSLFVSYGKEKSLILAECGVGLNPKATLTGMMLTDEGALGTIHFGFGSNITIGGLNDIAFHIDFVCRSATISVDGAELIANGWIAK